MIQIRRHSSLSAAHSLGKCRSLCCQLLSQPLHSTSPPAHAAMSAAATPTPTQALLSGLGAQWEQATVSHPFLRACRDGSISAAQFNTWLTQDYLYVRGFVGFAGAVLACAPDAHIETLLEGVGALAGELAWFQDKAAQRGLQLHTTGMQPACQAYRSLLAELKSRPYATQAAAFWAIEACYHEAWGGVLREGTAEQYKEFAHRWGNPHFGAYVDKLAANADEALGQSPEQAGAAKELVVRIVELELGFWSMAYAGGGAAA